ncbi:Os02g0470400 [Oryza sativa Japonica Group]|uniref:Os02g0470400 protein n=1 Tax=Oryza sativa subsp. japonica TaxID=39947 RepID=Q0E193_ORYSJ|nr:Os02g0470400 [Oryza sativa Japonica Group]|eukprot:NP_001046831.2 Os02g0470400 [Oryza sativa Japonica Group]
MYASTLNKSALVHRNHTREQRRQTVNVVQSSRGLSVKTKLHSLKIKDELQGRLSMSSNYLACSVINDNLETVDSSSPDEEDHRKSFSVEEDSFMDALTDFTPDQSPNLQDLEIPSNSIFDPDGHTQLSSKDGLSFDGDQQKVKPTEVFYEAQDNNINDFVVLTFLTRTPDSCLYDGIDSQMCIRMSALEFYCNRPTLVALIEFGFDLSMVNSAPKGDSDTTPAVRNVKPTGMEDNARNFVKGLLGYGKRRTIFNMKMDVDRVSMFLNKEDGSQLAMFVQEKFLFDLKVHPGSFSIDGMLGNMRFCDMSLGPEHRWGWLCDIRKPGVESLIKFAFQSYSVDDDDYEGYNYSLIGQLSAVRIVFLYRFVQEFTSYFMELATPHTEEAIKFIDKVGGFEWLIQKYEIDGASAIKLDLSLDTPIIIVPKNSQSKDYIQLDLGQLKVRNGFCWRGGEESDPSAVRLDILQAEINGINMAVGVNGILGKSMIREGHGINIEVRRSLRDVFKRVPMLCMKFQIGLLHGIMSDKEYNVITSCISTNLSEAPNLPPGFRDNVNRTKDSIRLLADKVNLNNHLLLSRTVVVMTVDVQYALFELRNGPDAESPLAELVLEGLWVSYRTTSLFEMDLYLSILKFLIHDIRPDTKSEMRLMLGSYSETSKLSTQDPSSDVGVSNLTMVILDYRWRSSFQSFVIRIQEPRVLVVLDFLLPVVEFFVPNLGTITGREESLDPKNDPLIKSDDIILCEPVFFQRENFIQLSPGRQLIVDGCDIDDFTYDGCGGTISLCDEYDKKGQLYSGTIIILGRGKKLRFKNVKIENGALLRRCVYLNAGSSYSISAEDGVEVSVLESSLNDNEDDNTQNEEYKRINALQPGADTPSAQMLNFTFEAQVVSPEFTFYDSSKLSIDDSLHIEKLLRAKMDFSFMYASKEKDIWARSVVKDLTIEAGSGLLVLEPVDVSWKYTSVSEKTNIVLASTDFGNNNPLVSCINFKRVWTSPNGELPGYNLTFWRPQAPSNYVILGDCVSSRCVPPSQVVVAVSNTYGRVRKPLGFRLVHVLPVSLEQMNSSQAAEDNECSIWIPVPPPGYIALGVTPGFSIWRVDNVIASFHAHNSIEQPTRVEALDLHHVLLRNPNCYIVKDLNADSSVRSNQPADQLTHRKSTSGWDAVRNLSRPSSYCMSTPHFERIWWDKGGDTKRPFSIWRPIPRFGFSSVGDCITEGFEPPTLGILFKCDSAIVSERPTQFKKVAQIDRKGSDEILFFWYPVPPPGYASLGCVATKTDEMPSNDSVCCPKMGLVNHANILEDPISRSSSSKGPNCWSIWKVSNQGCTFLATSDTKKPPAQMAYRIADHAKPKVRENITAELKFGCLSVSILDSSCGMVTPIFDTTIANINLATHGKFETMNAVLICSISASTFNRHLEAWEPFVEPFDGIFKFETYDTSKHPPSKVGKRIRVAATSPLNDTVDSVKNADDLSCSALDEDDFQRIVFENKLGCDIYVKKLEDNEDIIELLQHENQVSLFMPPPRFSDKLSVLSNSTESRYYVIIQIFESKGLPIMDDGNDHSYFCALRLLVGSDVSDQYKIFPQSARTRCVKPLKTCESQTHHAKWNEHFIFEVPEQASAHLEIEVTNLASKAGKGEVLGSLSIPIGRGATILKRAASMRIIQQAADVKRVLTCPLTRKGQALNHENVKHCGMLVLSSCYVERSTQTNFQSWKDSLSNAKSGFWIGLGPDGPWECFTAALPLSTIPKSLNNSHFALEVTMRNGKKHASLRALAIIANGFDIKLEVSVCPVTMHSSSVSNAGSTSSTSIIDEVFENQWYRPTSGWGSNPASDQGCDVGPWSTKDGSYSSKAFFEPRLPPGWKWTSPWKIEISSSVDSDGWAYAANFQNLNWPSSWKSSKSPHDFVRRRRWVRSRQSMQEQSAEIPRKIIAVMEPHASTALPWTAMIKDMDLCLQVRPFSEKSQESYSWSQVLSLGSESIPKQQQSSLSRQSTLKQSSVPSKNSVLRLADLEKKDMLSYCCPPVGIKQNFWLSVGIDASILHTDLNMPIYDWKICFNSILRLENKLPYEAEYAIWEKSTEGSMVERQHGIVSSGGSAFIYSADIRKPIYLTMFVQNGWIIEKDYMNRSAGVRFESRDNNSSPARVAICVAVGSCKQYSIGVSLFDLENKEHVDVKAFTSDGSYYWFSAQLKMTSDRTKLRLEGYKWSTPFSIDANGVMCVLMNNTTGNDQALVRVNVRSGTKCSRYEVVFQLACWSSPYRVENRSMFLPVRFRQVGGDDYSWRSLPPNSSASFFWEDIGRRRLLEVLVDGSDPTTSMTYDIDVVMDHQPLAASSRVKKALRVTVLKEGKFHVTQINDWLPDNRTREQTTERLLSPIFQPSEVDSGQSSPDLDSEFHVTLELTEFGLSIIDHMPEEILFLSVQQLLLAYSSGMGSGINRLKMQMHWIQVDNQLPFVLMPVLFCPQRMENQSDYIIKFSMTLQTNNSLEFCVYPYLGVQVPENCVFFVNIHEPIIWRLHEMIQNLKFDRISSSESSAVSVDPILKIGLLNISEIRFRVSMAMSPTQRPRGVLGFWSSLMTALGNMEHMPVRIAQRYREELCMRQSALMSSAMSNIQKDILSQPLQLLSGVDILGNASSALSNMSKGIAALSMDKKFIQGRMRQDSKGVEDFGDVIRDGGGALAKGIFRGVTGILTKPIEGAKSSGVEGFVQGVGKGLIGAAAQPVSGVLDLLSKTTEGANAVKMKISSAIMAEEQLARRRLPRAIGGDSLLYPYDDHKAAGQAILQLAEYATFLGQVDLFKVRGKFASTDAYEDHFMLPKGKILLITHRRVLLLQVPMMTQRKFSPAKDPCSVIWDVLWDDLVTVEMTHGKKDAPGSLPSKLILYLKAKPTNSREVVRLVKCNRGSDQATLIYSSIDGAYKAYGPKSTKELLRWKVPRPYAPRNTSGRTVQDLSYGNKPCKLQLVEDWKSSVRECPLAVAYTQRVVGRAGAQHLILI